jgi:hypothetical protein
MKITDRDIKTGVFLEKALSQVFRAVISSVVSRPSSPVINKVTAKHGLDMVHFYFIGGCIVKNQIAINQIKNPFLLACSNSKNNLALEVGFLAENSLF